MATSAQELFPLSGPTVIYFNCGSPSNTTASTITAYGSSSTNHDHAVPSSSSNINFVHGCITSSDEDSLKSASISLRTMALDLRCRSSSSSSTSLNFDIFDLDPDINAGEDIALWSNAVPFRFFLPRFFVSNFTTLVVDVLLMPLFSLRLCCF